MSQLGWPDNRQLQILQGWGGSIVSLAQLHRIDLFSSTYTTRLFGTHFQVDLEKKFVRGKSEGFEAGDEKCYMCTRICDVGHIKEL